MKHFTTSTALELPSLNSGHVWDTELAFEHFKAMGEADTKRTAERRLHALHLLPKALSEHELRDERDQSTNRVVLSWAINQARKRRDRVLLAQVSPLPGGQQVLHANDARGARFWIALHALDADAIKAALVALQKHIGKPIAVFPHGELVGVMRSMASSQDIQLCRHAYQPAALPTLEPGTHRPTNRTCTPQLKRLEAESIHIIREAVAEAGKPVMLYSAGKDSDVMLHLLRKAFYPSPPPLPLLHIDTHWKFQETYLFRDLVARKSAMELLVYSNPQALEKQINPFDHGSTLHTQITKTEGLTQALDHYQFDVALSGARRDEDPSRSKERVFSLRSATHQWDPQNQRPEVWNLYNSRKDPAANIRVFPLSNWTELNIWQYIHQENIAVAPLYFAQPRPVVVRPDMIMAVDDERCRLLPNEKIQIKTVRFRTLGCYPLTGAVESEAQTPEAIIQELMLSRWSERHARKVDSNGTDTMERQKREGYF